MFVWNFEDKKDILSKLDSEKTEDDSKETEIEEADTYNLDIERCQTHNNSSKHTCTKWAEDYVYSQSSFHNGTCHQRTYHSSQIHHIKKKNNLKASPHNAQEGFH